MSIHRLTAAQLRQLFDESGYLEQAQAGQLLTSDDDGTPDPVYNQPPGTVSRVTHYYQILDGGAMRKVAVTHAFVLPDGSINNRAGLPDPKYVYIDGARYVLER